jgi:hypothetical protein
MNGIKLLSRKSLFPVLLAFTTAANAVNIWPDRIEPPVRLDEAVSLSKTELSEIDADNFYCVNATLLNGEDGDTSTGYWLLGFMTETGNNYSTAVRMDRKLQVKKVKSFKFNLRNHWPDTVTPTVSVEEALEQAITLLEEDDKNFHYCLNATLVTSSDTVTADGMWNFVFQTTTDDPLLINIRMNGKTGIKEIKHIEEYKVE